MKDTTLLDTLSRSLHELEEANEIVICSASPKRAALTIHDAVRAVMPTTDLTQDELSAVRSLIFYAVADKRFFDWEMPTLTGLTADEFTKVAKKMPTG